MRKKAPVKKTTETGTDDKIDIKPQNRGKFTAKATKRGDGVQEFATKVLANKSSYKKATVKQAQFAKNAAKFKHPKRAKK